MQWTNGPNAGFTTASAKLWLAVNPNYITINAVQETADPNSVYKLHRPTHRNSRLNPSLRL
jgi:hypothetical protein